MTMLADNISIGFDLLRNVSLEVEAGKVTLLSPTVPASLLKVLCGGEQLRWCLSQ